MKRFFAAALLLALLWSLAACGAGERDPLATAQSYEGRQVEELLEVIGEPERTTYQDSCAKPGAQDGFLYYDGFVVVTERTEDGELIQYAEARD